MQNENPEKYIRRMRSQGMADGAIFKRLLLAGWTHDELQSIFYPEPDTISVGSFIPRSAAQPPRPIERRRMAVTVGACCMLMLSGAAVYTFYGMPLTSIMVPGAAAQAISTDITTPIETTPPVTEVAEPEQSFAYVPKGPHIVGNHFLAVDLQDGTILAKSRDEAVAPIASITKLMTALVAIDAIDFDLQVNVPAHAAVTTAVPRLRVGAVERIDDLFVLMMTESSNEAAEAIAGAVGRDRFIALMNKKAKELGLSDTSFADPSGLSAHNTSTTNDLFLLLQYIYEQHGSILDLTSGIRDGKTATVEEADILNFNFIPGTKERFVGGKVGNTDEAKGTYAGIFMLPVAKTEVRPVAIIVLGSDSVRTDVKAVLAYLDELYGE